MTVKVVLVMAGRLRRGKRLRRSVMVIGLVSWILLTFFIALRAFSLSPSQTADRDLGRFASSTQVTGLRGVAPGNEAPTSNVAEASRSTGTPALALLTSVDVTAARAGRDPIGYFETAWSSDPFPERFVLVKGRWPSAPGEVGVTRGLVADRSGQLEVLSGNERVTVVGIVEDRYATRSVRILAAPGTWASWGSPMLRSRFPYLAATISALSTEADPEEFASALASSLGASLGPESDGGPAGPMTDGAGAGTPVVTTRAEILGRERSGAVSQYPLVFLVPVLLLPPLAAAVVGGVNYSRVRRVSRQLGDVGFEHRVIATGFLVAVVALATGWAILGAGLGVASGWVVRLAVPGLAGQPVGPWVVPAGLGALVVAALVVCTTGGVLLTSRSSLAHTGPQDLAAPAAARSAPRLNLSRARVVLAAALLAAVLYQSFRLSDVTDAMVLTGLYGAAVVLLVPTVVGLLLQWLPEVGPRTRLFRRQFLAEQRRVAASVAALTACLGLAAAFAVQLSTLVTSDAASRVQFAAPSDIVLLNASGAGAPDADLLTTVQADAHVTGPAIRTSLACDSNGTCLFGADGDFGPVRAVDSINDVELISGHSLNDAQRTVLESGGVLSWSDDEDHREMFVGQDPQDPTTTKYSVPNARIDMPEAYQVSSTAIMLTAATQTLGVETTPAMVVIPDCSAGQMRAAVAAVTERGYDPRSIAIYVTPESNTPAVLYVGGLGLCALALSVTGLLMRNQAVSLRPYSATLLSVGVSVGWVRQVLTAQVVFLVASAGGASLILAIPPVALSALLIHGYVFDVPWLWTAELVGGFVLIAAVATVLTSRSLRAEEKGAGVT